jgi:PleD family two-component response regulator
VLLVGVDQPSSQRLRLALDNLAPTEFFEAADGIQAMEVAKDARPYLAVVQAGSDSYGAFGLTRDLLTTRSKRSEGKG